jgi:tRNA-specific 2-thiouridylase
MKNLLNFGRNSNIKNGKKVFVGLSGGVDSAVSAALLKYAGYDVTGVFIKVWQPDFAPCTWREERRDAMRVALALDVPFLFLDLEEEYKKGVADKMIEEYKKGRTPNPDVLCNREVKFGAFWREAKKLGADYIATGHYAQIDTAARLVEGADSEKDQSYFLWTLTPEDLKHVLFPIGHLKKTEVRELAKKFKLPVAEKKDSQGICFIGEVSMDEFLSHYTVSKPGKVLNVKGETIGSHKGALYYTIGERHGFEVTRKKSEDGAYYVVGKDMLRNTITVSNVDEEIVEASPKKILIKKANWITEPKEALLEARIRYRGRRVPVELMLEGKHLTVEFSEPQRGLSLGQSIVLYQGRVVLGGAIMDKVLE